MQYKEVYGRAQQHPIHHCQQIYKHFFCRDQPEYILIKKEVNHGNSPEPQKEFDAKDSNEEFHKRL